MVENKSLKKLLDTALRWTSMEYVAGLLQRGLTKLMEIFEGFHISGYSFSVWLYLYRSQWNHAN